MANLRKRIMGVIYALAVLGIAGFLAARFTFGSSEELEKWIGRQIVAIVNTFLVPQISFADIHYEAPATVSMTDVAFTAPEGVRIIDLRGFALTLAETPTLNKPVVIERVRIDHGRINLVSDDKTGRLRGLSPIAKSAGAAAPIRAAGESAKEAEFRLSDVLQLRLIDLKDVGLHYEPGSGKPPIQLDGITTQLKIDPEGEAGQPGWYKLDFAVEHRPSLSLGLRGRLNLDTRVAELEEGRLTLQVGPESMSSLPSELQAILRQYEARGELDLRVSGRVPLSDAMGGTLGVRAELKNFRMALGERRWMIESLVAEFAFANRQARLKSFVARLLKGQVLLTAKVDMAAPDLPADLEWTITDLDISELRAASVSSEEGVAGLLSSRGTAQAALARLPASITGSGRAGLRNGRLMGLPLMSALGDLLKIGVPAKLSATDKAEARFSFTPQGVRVDRTDIITTLLAARGEGIIAYDGRLDMRVNAGPIEKLQSLLGKAGDLLGKLTDKLVAYKVEGRVGQPVVRLMVLDQKLGK